METIKYCRICLEEGGGILTSIFNTEFAMMPSEMIMLCAKVKVNFHKSLSLVSHPFHFQLIPNYLFRSTRTTECLELSATTVSTTWESLIISNNK